VDDADLDPTFSFVSDPNPDPDATLKDSQVYNFQILSLINNKLDQ
jgi:hypothetical protein